MKPVHLAHKSRGSVNPQMVILGRESRGLSQKQLAAKLGVTQGRISKIETGLLPVSDDLLRKLADVLHYPPHFFYQEGGVTGIGIAEVFHRKRRSASQHLLTQVYAQIELRIRHVSGLLRAADITCSIPRLDVDEYDAKVDEIARTVRVQLQLPRGPIQDMTQTIENAGGIVIPFDFGTPLVDAISRWIPGLPPLFFVNAESPKDRARLSLAHELGHMVMHTYPTPEIEEQAFRFAGEFLMPERDIAMDLKDTSLPRLANLKRYWKVSMAALLTRAEELGCIKPNQARYLWAQMAKAGYKTREPIELDVSGEQPSLIHELVETHQKELSYTVADLKQLLPLEDDELQSYYLHDWSQPHPSLRLVQP